MPTSPLAVNMLRFRIGSGESNTLFCRADVGIGPYDRFFNNRANEPLSHLKCVEILIQGDQILKEFPHPGAQLLRKGIVTEVLVAGAADNALPGEIGRAHV